MTIIEIIGLAIAFFSALVGYLTWRDKRKDKKDQEFRKEKEKEQQELLNGIEFKLTKSLKNYVSREESEREHSLFAKKLIEVENKVDLVKDKLDDHFHESIESELNRLATDIVNYAEDLRNGIPKSSNSYRHILKCYDRYKKLDGNSYIDIEFNYIKKTVAEMLEEIDNA